MDTKRIKVIYRDTPAASWNLGYGMLRAAEKLGCLSSDAKITLFSGGFEKMIVDEVKENLNDFTIAIAAESTGYPHLDKKYRYDLKLKLVDLVCTSDMENTERFYALGAKKVHYVPNWVDEEVFHPLDIPQDVDFSFCGNIYDFRKQFHQEMSVLPVHHFRARGTTKKELAENIVININRTKVNFNYPSYFRGYVGRVTEVLACGGFLLQPERKEDMHRFEDRKHLVMYHSPQEAIELARYYLEHEEERKKIAEEGMRFVLENHTAVRTLQEILELIDA